MTIEHRRFETRSISTWLRFTLWPALLVLAASSALAQDLLYESVVAMGGSKHDVGQSIAVDASGNSLITGYFSGSVDFDPGAGATVFNAVDTGTAFVAKYDASNNLVWAFPLGGIGSGENANRGLSIAVASNGDVVVFGLFSGTTDFNPGAGTFNLTARAGTNDLFVARYSAAGAFLWAFRLPLSPGLLYSHQHNMTLDNQGNIVFVGSFVGTVDFDPGAKRHNVTASSTALGCADLYVAKYSPAGAFIWAFGVGSPTDYELAAAVAVDGNNDIVVTGRLGSSATRTTVDFNPASRVTNNVTPPGGDDIFVAKYSSAGAYRWAFAIGGRISDRSMAITTDADDNVVVTGFFMDTVDFDPGTSVAALAKVRNNPSEYFSMFVAKYSATGGYLWAIKLANGYGQALATDADGDIFVAGTTVWSWDLDPGDGINIVGTGPFNGIVGRYASTGDYVDAFGLDGSVSHVCGLARDGNGDVRITGDFGGYYDTTDFDPNEGTATLSAAAPDFPDTLTRGDIFVATYGEEVLLKPNVDARSAGGNDIELSIAPNPFTGEFSLRLDGTSTPGRLEIIDMMGRVVERREIVDAGEQFTLGSALPAGAYMLQIVRGDQRRSIMVQKAR